MKQEASILRRSALTIDAADRFGRVCIAPRPCTIVVYEQYIALAEEKELTADDLVISDIRVGKQHPGTGSDSSWEFRPGDVWVLRSNYTGDSHSVVTGVDVLFGVDAIDPRSEWALIHPPLRLDAQPGVPVASLSIRHGKPKPRPDGPRTALRVREDGKFKIVQISDTHMVTGVGVCKDAMDAGGQPLPESEADPLTIDFLGGILDVEKPDLVVLTGDQLHHDNLDSQSALFKVVAPMIERSIPYAAVFGNHDDEGTYALSREFSFHSQRSTTHSRCQKV
jgi:Calcineurin-like phosphoesterase